ncbi:MAG: hypothetical protein J6386_04050 [Candidatus Synoicihabitans palmerolidicus]|nr:hypothetical protein [Candidatus Synoicihabitans palmerolidicus]
MVVVLEELEHAKARGARIYAELTGYGASADAFHLSSLSPGGEGSQRSMRAALASAGVGPEAMDFVAAHATSTPGGEGEEAAAIASVFVGQLETLHVSAVTSMTGHLLGRRGRWVHLPRSRRSRPARYRPQSTSANSILRSQRRV